MTYYGIYKITNLLNGKMYIGQHKTSNLDDGYMGSGLLIERAIKKYGKENFRKEWLMFCEDEEELNYMERVYVDQTWVDRSDTYNLTLGGDISPFASKPKGWNKGKNNGFFGKRHSEANKKKWSEMKKGKAPNLSENSKLKLSTTCTNKNINRHWFTDGNRNVFTYECPEGFRQGKIHFNKKEEIS